MVLDEGHHPGDTGDMRIRVRRWLNEEMIQTAGEFDFPGLLTKSVHVLVEAFGVTADEFDIFARGPYDLLRIIKAEILDPADSPVRLHEMKVESYANFRRLFLRDSSTSTTRADKGTPGRPITIAFRRLDGVDLVGVTLPIQWTVASTLTEDASLTASVHGYFDLAHRFVNTRVTAAQITASPQNVGGSGEIAEALTFSKSAASVGRVSLSDGTTIRGVIEPAEFNSQVTQFLLHPWRDRTDYSLYLTYKRRPPQMVLDSDVPSGMPYEAWEIIRYSALAKILAFIENTGEQEKAERTRNQLKAALRTKLGEEQIEEAGFAWESPRSGEWITEMD